MSKVSIAPKLGVLRPYFESNLGWKGALGELIDNALDAGADSVRIIIHKDFIRVQDNGGIGAKEAVLTDEKAPTKNGSTTNGTAAAAMPS